MPCEARPIAARNTVTSVKNGRKERGGCEPGRAELRSDDFARIHNGKRIECFLDAPHDGPAGAPVFCLHELAFALTDTMLAGAGSSQGQRSLHEPVDELSAAIDFLLIVKIDQHQRMEVAVSEVTEDRSNKVVG